MDEKLDQFIAYLKSHGHRLRTIDSYVSGARGFLSWLEKEKLALEKVSYAELLKWVGHEQGRGLASRTINHNIRAINKLYTSQELSSPGMELRIRGEQHKLLSEGGHILSAEELNELYEKYGLGGLSGKRNKAILGIVIYQALRRGELQKLRIEDLDLEKGLLRIPETPIGATRILDLTAVQLPALQDYIYQIRPLINLLESDRLFMSMGTGSKLSNSLSYLSKELKKINSKVKTLTQLRQSRITIWLQQNDIRQVQYMAGHRYVSATQRYQANDLESLQERIEEVHPLNR